MDLSHFRQEYSTKGLDENSLLESPIELFKEWFKQAIELGIYEPNAMSLATVPADGKPSVRTVLLKIFDERGFTFFTNYNSRKATEIEANPAVGILFPWLDLERQISIQGRAQKTTAEESLSYFQSRPRDSQIGAWVSDQSSVISSREVLEENLQKLSEKFENKDVPLPPHWGGYRVVPETIEFWQGGAARIHDRFLYTAKPNKEWLIRRLSP